MIDTAILQRSEREAFENYEFERESLALWEEEMLKAQMSDNLPKFHEARTGRDEAEAAAVEARRIWRRAQRELDAVITVA